MRKPHGIIFDLGSTVVQQKSIDWHEGSKRLLETCSNPLKATAKDLAEFGDKFWEEMSRVIEPGGEFSEHHFLKLVCETFGMKPRRGYLRAEIDYWKASLRYEVVPGIVQVLRTLDRKGIQVGALSNSSFRHQVLEAELARHRIRHYFSFVMSSADYSIVKPNPRLFALAVKMMGLESKDVWFAGDTLEADIKGASDSELFPVWYNPESKPNTLKCKCLEIRNWKEFAALIRDWRW